VALRPLSSSHAKSRLILSSTVWAAGIPPAPTSSIYVQDYAGVINADTKVAINGIGSQLAAKTKAQIVVVTINTLDGVPLEDFALGILREWGVGDKTLSNGVVMLIVTDDKKSRIEVGYGLEGALPDAKTGRIQDEYMLPYFKQGDYNQGIRNGYLALADAAAKEYQVELGTGGKPARSQQENDLGGGKLPWWLKVAILTGLVVLFGVDWLFWGGALTLMLLSIFSRRGGGGGSGGYGGGGYGGGSGGGGGSSRGW
jgi:uncharacterized protein